MVRSRYPYPVWRMLSTRRQAMYIRVRLPGFRTRFDGKTMVAFGDIQPSELSKTYRIRLDYRFHCRPRVQVISPKLERYNDEDIPHMYGQEYLCLYLPGAGDWSPDKEIAKTIIPWAALWLNYYELWHATGEWLGGGHEPGDDEDPMQREVVIK